MSAEPPERERPRWSFTWLVRVQRTGRNRRELSAGDEQRSGRLWRAALWLAVIAVLLVEVWLGIILGVLPR